MQSLLQQNSNKY